MKKVLVGVDITNQYYSILHAHKGLRIDYGKYLNCICSDLNLSLHRAFAYGVELDNEAYHFKTVLRNLGYELRYRQAVTYGDNADMRRTPRNLMMAMDIWRALDKIDVVVIGSSDPELIPLVQRIKELGIQVVIYSFNISRELKETADRFIEIDLNRLEYRGSESA